MLPSFKRGEIYLLNAMHKSWNHFFVILFGKLCNLMQLCHNLHLPHGFTPTNTCPTKNFNNRCLGYDAFECLANLHIIFKWFAKGRNKKTCLGYVAPKMWRWQQSNMCSWIDSNVNELRAHSHIGIKLNSKLYIIKIIHMVGHSRLEDEKQLLKHSRNHSNWCQWG